MIDPGSEMRHVPEVLATFLKLFHPVSIRPHAHVETIFLMFQQIAFSPLAEWWVWAKSRGLDKVLSYASPAAVTDWEKIVATCLEKRTKVEEENRAMKKPKSEIRKDFFYYLFDAKDPETGTGYDLNELYGECELLIVAGPDKCSAADKLTVALETTGRLTERISSGLSFAMSSSTPPDARLQTSARPS